VTILSGGLNPQRYETVLVTGALGPGEGSFEHLAVANGARVEQVASLGPELRLKDDLRSLLTMIRIMRRYQPDIVHTHTAKAGMVGRLAAWIALGRRPVVVHTYHGHVLTGYFGPTTSRIFRGIERALARITDRLIGLSQATVDDLVTMRVAPQHRFRVIPTGLHLDPFSQSERSDGAHIRAEFGVSDDDFLAVFVGRLVPIKRVDVLLRAVAHARETGTSMRLLLVGDGPLRAELEQLANTLGLSGSVTFLGLRFDMPSIFAACDVAVLTSDNEAIPVAMIEAAAAGRAAIATDVGGVAEVVTSGTGYLVPPGDAAAMGNCLVHAATHRSELVEKGRVARENVMGRYGSGRLIRDLEGFYEELLSERAHNGGKRISGPVP